MDTVCRGERCSVRGTCLRHSNYYAVTQNIGGITVINKCTNQRKYVQDETKVNKDGQP